MYNIQRSRAHTYLRTLIVAFIALLNTSMTSSQIGQVSFLDTSEVEVYASEYADGAHIRNFIVHSYLDVSSIGYIGDINLDESGSTVHVVGQTGVAEVNLATEQVSSIAFNAPSATHSRKLYGHKAWILDGSTYYTPYKFSNFGIRTILVYNADGGLVYSHKTDAYVYCLGVHYDGDHEWITFVHNHKGQIEFHGVRFNSDVAGNPDPADPIVSILETEPVSNISSVSLLNRMSSAKILKDERNNGVNLTLIPTTSGLVMYGYRDGRPGRLYYSLTADECNQQRCDVRSVAFGMFDINGDDALSFGPYASVRINKQLFKYFEYEITANKLRDGLVMGTNNVAHHTDNLSELDNTTAIGFEGECIYFGTENQAGQNRVVAVGWTNAMKMPNHLVALPGERRSSLPRFFSTLNDGTIIASPAISWPGCDATIAERILDAVTMSDGSTRVALGASGRVVILDIAAPIAE